MDSYQLDANYHKALSEWHGEHHRLFHEVQRPNWQRPETQGRLRHGQELHIRVYDGERQCSHPYFYAWLLDNGQIIQNGPRYGLGFFVVYPYFYSYLSDRFALGRAFTLSFELELRRP